MAAIPACKLPTTNPRFDPSSELRGLNAAGSRSVRFQRRRVRSVLYGNGDITSSSTGEAFVSVPEVPSVPMMLGSIPPKRPRKSVCLFYCEEMRELAEQVALESDAIQLRSINWRTFEDGFPNLFIPNAHGIRGQHVAFLASLSSPKVLFEQFSIIYALPRLFISSFTVILPFFPTGTYERMEDEGDVPTAPILARFFSNIPLSRGGPTSLVIFDIHALQERFYFGDNVLPCFESGIPLLKNRLQELPDSDNISIAFPDEGSWKRFHQQLQHFPVIICTKVREGNQRFVRLKEGNPNGRHVVIVDDLVQSGSTLIECQKVLAARGAAKISAYVTHGIFPNGTWERFQYDNGVGPEKGLSYFWITDSCPITAAQVNDRPPFEILSLARPIADAVQI
ncbi:ribose-phosphate pyrophosphokinase 4-like [Dioscorea cayenensis subsp. rotundata]|uniref:ribose-phosphate diphosphokinase n=1 Tax=Dioscorea cayennensis subsp. rotundata TaxID=55577 RepID=A0AB40CRT7_DIOCR|nr:ribose-phosphate pyrophosphokinase 4-like [Dioscorea cayenensis subsp. rotundata]